jgi:REP element-mobilizing transposase RayT
MRNELDLPTRRSIRLQHMDYSQPGAYFVTLCAFDKHCLFGKVESGRTQLSPIGEIVRACWVDIPNHFSGVCVDTFVVMPNHLHGILAVEERARRAVPLRDEERFEGFRKAVPGSVPTMVRSYKSAVTKLVRDTTGNRALQVWQSSYFERILRNGDEFANASRYILENPSMWHLDKENPAP